MAIFRTQTIWLLVLICANSLHAGSKGFELSMSDAEARAFEHSSLIKALNSDVNVAAQQEAAVYTGLLPRLMFRGNYTFLSTLAELSFNPNAPVVTFGSRHNYSLGLQLNYTLWDSHSTLKSYQAAVKVKEARQQNVAQSRNQVLYSVRVAYVRAQLAFEELQLITGSLKLSRAQNNDVMKRFKEGAAAQLDTIVSRRQVLGYQMQFEQKQGELLTALRELLSWIGDDETKVESAASHIKLDDLRVSLATWQSRKIAELERNQPQLRAQELLAQSADLEAASQTAKLYPKLDLSLSTAWTYPNGPALENISQNTIGIVLTVPLYLGDPTWHLAAQKRHEAQSARFRARQLKNDIERDFNKADQILQSLYEQKKLVNEDVKQSNALARLYFSSYKEGKGSLIDVQAANNASLQAKVNAARIDAQILTQLILRMVLSGKEVAHDEYPTQI